MSSYWIKLSDEQSSSFSAARRYTTSASCRSRLNPTCSKHERSIVKNYKDSFVHLKLWKNKNTLSLCPITHTVTNPRPTKKNPKTKQEGLVRLSDKAEDDIALLTIFNRVEKVRTISTFMCLEHIQQKMSPWPLNSFRLIKMSGHQWKQDNTHRFQIIKANSSESSDSSLWVFHRTTLHIRLLLFCPQGRAWWKKRRVLTLKKCARF